MANDRQVTKPPQQNLGQKQQVRGGVIAVKETISTRFEGPLPPPEMLVLYEQVYPGCAKEIVGMAVQQSTHRQGLETTVVNGNVSAQTRGQYCGLAVSLTAVIGGVVLIAIDKDAQGLVAILGALGSLVGVFVYGRWRQERERARNIAPPSP